MAAWWDFWKLIHYTFEEDPLSKRERSRKMSLQPDALPDIKTEHSGGNLTPGTWWGRDHWVCKCFHSDGNSNVIGRHINKCDRCGTHRPPPGVDLDGLKQSEEDATIGTGITTNGDCIPDIQADPEHSGGDMQQMAGRAGRTPAMGIGILGTPNPFKRKMRWMAQLFKGNHEVSPSELVRISHQPFPYGRDKIGTHLWGNRGYEDLTLTWHYTPEDTVKEFLAKEPDKVVVTLYDGTANKMEEWIIPYERIASIATQGSYCCEDDTTEVTFRYTDPPYYQNFFEHLPLGMEVKDAEVK